MDQVHDMVNGGVISQETLAWTKGQATWKPLKEILATTAPPPIPACKTQVPSVANLSRPANDGTEALSALRLLVAGSAQNVHAVTGSRLTDEEARHVFSKAVARLLDSGEPKTAEEMNVRLAFMATDANHKIDEQQAKAVCRLAKDALLNVGAAFPPSTAATLTFKHDENQPQSAPPIAPSSPKQEPPKAFDLADRITMLRNIYWTSGAQIYASSSDGIAKYCAKEGFTLPEAARVVLSNPGEAMGVLTSKNIWLINADKATSINLGTTTFIFTPDVAFLCGPTLYDALEYGYFRLVCNFAGRVLGNLTEQDVLQHAHDLKQWFITPRVTYASNPTPQRLCQDVNKTLALMRELGRGTPLVPLIDKIPMKKSLFNRLFSSS